MVPARSNNIIMVGGKKVLKAYYIAGDGNQLNINPTSKTFYKRVYWLIENPELCLIHYLDSKYIKKGVHGCPCHIIHQENKR